MSTETFQYPQREQFFFNKFIREMSDRAIASELGRDVAMLLTIIASQEDTCRYAKPVTFYSLPLMEKCGFCKFEQLANAREAAKKHGWLKFISKGRGSRQAATYFVAIPEDDIEESTPDQYHCTGVEKGIESGIDSGVDLGVETGVEKGVERGIIHTYPYSLPVPLPKDNTPYSPPAGDGGGESIQGESSSKGTPSPKKTKSANVDPEKFDLPPSMDSIEWRKVVRDWLEYKRELGEGYKPRGFKSLLEQLEGWGLAKSNVSVHRSMAANWKGLFEPKDMASHARGSPEPQKKNLYGYSQGANIVKELPREQSTKTSTSGSGESDAGRDVPVDAGVDREAGP